MTHEFDTHLQEYQAWLEERPTLLESNKDLNHLTYLLYLEMLELMDAVADGDMDEVAGEVADVFNFALSMAFLNGIDILEVARGKIKRNHEKYPKDLFQNGTPVQESVTKSRNEWDASK